MLLFYRNYLLSIFTYVRYYLQHIMLLDPSSDGPTNKQGVFMYSLQEKRFEYDKKEVHRELVNYFVDLGSQKRLWHFTLATKSFVDSRHFTNRQAGQFVERLVEHYGITRANIEAAYAFTPFRTRPKIEKTKVIQLNRTSMPNDDFEEHLATLDSLINETILEFRQALELVLMLLDQYPGNDRKIPCRARRYFHS